MDRWQSKAIKCKGGLILNMDTYTQGTEFPGSAVTLVNYEPSIKSGYTRILGYEKFWNGFDPVDGNPANTAPITGVGIGLSGVFATRELTGVDDNAIFYSAYDTPSFTQVSSAARTGGVTKSRFIFYSISEPVVIQTDGFNHAWRCDAGFTDTEINGTGAPADPQYAALWRNRLALSGYSANLSAVSLSAPNDDSDFDGANGAIEVNVGDVVTGIKTFRDELYIFCENSIHKLTGTVSSNMTITDVSNRIGCISHDTIQEIGGDLVFLSNDGFRTISATERIGDTELGLVSSAIQPLVAEMFDLQLTKESYSACIVRTKSQYRVFYRNPDAADADAQGFLAKLTDTPLTSYGQYEWAETLGFPVYCCDSNYITTTNLDGDITNVELVAFGHPTNGYVYLMERGQTLDGETIVNSFSTPPLIFEDSFTRKVFHKLKLFLTSDDPTLTEIKVRTTLGDIDPDIPDPPDYTLTYTDAQHVYVNGFVYTINLIGSGGVVVISFINVDNGDAPHTITAFEITYALKGRR